MFQLNVLARPGPQKRRFLATRDIASPHLPAEHAELLAHIAAGTSPHRPGERIVLSMLRTLRRIWARVCLFGILSRIGLLASVWAASRIFEQEGSLSAALGIAVLYFGFQLFSALAQYWSDIARGHAAQAVELFLTTIINRKLTRLDAQSATQFSSGTLKNLITSDVNTFGEFVSTVTWNLVPALFSVVLLGPIIFVVAGLPGLLGIIAAFLNVPLSIVISRSMRRYHARAQKHSDSLGTIVSEWLRNVRLARFLGWQPAFQRDIAKAVDRYLDEFVRRHALACLTFGVSFSWWMVPVTTILVAAHVLGHPLDMKGFFASLWVIKDLGDYLQHLPHSINLSSAAAVTLDRIEKLVAAPETAARLTTGARAPAAEARPVALELRDVRMRLGEQTVFDGLSLDFDLTRRVAIVGEVGCGKTTLLRLLTGELAPDAGTIAVRFSDGAAGSLWDAALRDAWRERMAYVPQEAFVSNATLAANIVLDDAPHAESDVLQAAAMAELAADLALMPKGLKEEIGETGVNLSGGQRQRVSLARAFASGRRLLVLDDPLSAVDGRTEAGLMRHILARADGLVLVSHRLHELHAVDRILVMENGRIVEDDVPTALIGNAASRFERFRAAAEAKHAAH